MGLFIRLTVVVALALVALVIVGFVIVHILIPAALIAAVIIGILAIVAFFRRHLGRNNSLIPR